MRQETAHIARAKRTETDGRAIFLHGNLIAWRGEDGSISATLAGWPTVTTRERLNGLCAELGVRGRFYQRDHTQHFGDDAIGDSDVVRLS